MHGNFNQNINICYDDKVIMNQTYTRNNLPPFLKLDENLCQSEELHRIIFINIYDSALLFSIFFIDFFNMHIFNKLIRKPAIDNKINDLGNVGFRLIGPSLAIYMTPERAY